MILETIVVTQMEANCYVLGCQRTKEAIVIDPGGDYEKVKRRIEENGLKVKCIVNTHGHIDHIGANAEFGVPVWIHRLDADFLRDPAKSLSAAFGGLYISPPPSRLLEDGDEVKFGEISLRVIHTPGHTPGGISLKYDDIVFTGDTLFCGGVGRTDFPYSSEDLLFESIRERLLIFDDKTVIYPGHGPSSTIGEERRSNPFI